MKAISGYLPKRRLDWWTFARKSVQYTLLIGLTGILIFSRGGSLSPKVSNILFRLDPLAVLAQALASRTFLAGSSLAILVVLLTVVFGRVWCGWLCPLGSLLDIFTLRKKNQKPVDFPESWRRFKYFILLSILIAALFTNLSLLILDPLTIFVRSFTTSFWPAVDAAFTALETVLYPVSFLSEAVGQLDALIRPAVLPLNPALYRYAFLYGSILVGIIALNRLAPRFWCRYICPLGGLLGWISKFSIYRREVTAACRDCKLCANGCPTGTIQAEKGYRSDPSECTVCLKCLDSCRLNGNEFIIHSQPSSWNSYDPTRRQTLEIFGLTAGAVALAQAEPSTRKPNPFLIQPPGALTNNFLSKCIRCGECMRACPTSGLQPAVQEAGISGISTPVLISRIGYCDYACNACGQICPVGAIPPLSLEEKRQTKIGLAYIDENRCMAWADHKDCIVCEEMCPLPQKAIHLLPTDIPHPGGETKRVKLPYVLRDQCIGCGICEYKCPVNGPAAIRIYTLGQAV